MSQSHTKNQHYVWRHYLGAWAIKGQVACYRQSDKKGFRTNPKNIASETYFYRLYDLNNAERSYLEQVVERARSGPMRDIHRNFVRMFQMTSGLRRLVEASATSPYARKKSEEILERAERTLGEDYQFKVEEKGKPLLDRLRRRDATFWGDEDLAADFAYFIATQYLRTARMRNVICQLAPPPGVSMERTWPIEAHLWATEIGSALFVRHTTMQALILVNETDIPFIAGDQPVINLNAQSEPEVKFYYPVTPTTALLLTMELSERAKGQRTISTMEAEHYNHAIYRWSDDQIYGVDPAYLIALAGSPKDALG